MTPAPRRHFFVSLLVAVLAVPIAAAGKAAFKAIFDITIQDFWKDTVAPFLINHIGPWSAIILQWIGPYWSGVGSAFLLILCVEMLFNLRRMRHLANAREAGSEAIIAEAGTASRAMLRLRFSGRLEAPEEIAKENIQSWFAYWSPGARAEDQDGQTLLLVPSSWVVFITFVEPVLYRQLAAHFTGARPTAWQVRQTLPTVAVLTVEGGMPECELEILTRS